MTAASFVEFNPVRPEDANASAAAARAVVSRSKRVR